MSDEDTTIAGLPLSRFIFMVVGGLATVTAVLLIAAGAFHFLLLALPNRLAPNEVRAVIVSASACFALSIPAFAAGWVLGELGLPKREDVYTFTRLHYGFCAAAVPSIVYAAVAAASVFFLIRPGV